MKEAANVDVLRPGVDWCKGSREVALINMLTDLIIKETHYVFVDLVVLKNEWIVIINKIVIGEGDERTFVDGIFRAHHPKHFAFVNVKVYAVTDTVNCETIVIKSDANQRCKETFMLLFTLQKT